MDALQSTPAPQQPEPSLHDKVIAIAEELLPGSKIPAAFQPIIRSQLKTFLAKVTEDDLRHGLMEVRDHLLPFLIGQPDENPHS